jgi:ribosomal protein S17E
MEAIRRQKVKRTGRQVTVELPDDFKAEEMEVIILPSTEEEEKKTKCH